jgi:transcriptional regulator with XRE-family HTH domain
MASPQPPSDDPVELLAEFMTEISRRRIMAGLSQGALGVLMGYHRTYVNKVEHGAIEPTADFARKIDEALRANGEIFRRYQALARAKARRDAPVSLHRHPSTTPVGPNTQLVVNLDDALLRYRAGRYELRMRRRLTNAGSAPVIRYLMRIEVDRYPNDPKRSNEHYRRNPLELEEVGLQASCDERPMSMEIKQDRDVMKEVWLLFQNDAEQFPLYPGQSTWITYSYHVGDDKWGPWFQRAIRFPTDRVAVRLAFPESLQPSAWGFEISPTLGQVALSTPLQRSTRDDEVVFDWATDYPPLQTRYSLEWTFHSAEKEAQNQHAE